MVTVTSLDLAINHRLRPFQAGRLRAGGGFPDPLQRLRLPGRGKAGDRGLPGGYGRTEGH